MFCKVCGLVDPEYDEQSTAVHSATVKHICNTILFEYKTCKRSFSKNREDVFIFGTAQAVDMSLSKQAAEKTDHHKIRIYVKPKQAVKFTFQISNESKKEELLVVGIQLAHPQPHFTMSQHPYIFGGPAHVLMTKSSITEDISVYFQGADIGQYEMPIMFTFCKRSNKQSLIFIREMVVMVEETPMTHPFPKNPYNNEDFKRAEKFISATVVSPLQTYKVPRLLKILLPRGLEEKALEGMSQPIEVIQQLRKVLIKTRAIFDEGITKENYTSYFHHLLWWEEIIAKINLRKYNMSNVTLERRVNVFVLEVPGLAEKRPSLIRNDRVFLQPKSYPQFIYECVISNIEDNYIHLSDLSQMFFDQYTPLSTFDVRFIMCRVHMERAHAAVAGVFAARMLPRLFPEPASYVPLQRITKFFNPLINKNLEQRSAVEHIVSGTSGVAPYIVFGPPGTGKTMTIVEAIIQLVVRSHRNRVLVCTDSNMAADHIALMLVRYNKHLNINNFIKRANSRSREWSVMPAELAPISNGTSYDNFQYLNNSYLSCYRIVVTTLLHAAKYAEPRNQAKHKLEMTHLFVDEAAQASEPHTLVPAVGLLSRTGRLVLAGDPQQLGPVCMSKEAYCRGLGVSLLERLKLTYGNLYDSDSNYITMLVQNFRNHPDILRIPNEIFYNNELVALAPPDSLSTTSILGLEGGERAVIFHALHSTEQRMGNAPSYFNEKELDMLKRYVRELMFTHRVAPEDIGIIAPYIRQVYKMKAWLTAQHYVGVEVGTVEAFQGKEKRVILVSTVRANAKLLDYDAKYGLGFLVDDKRYNVTLTRAKAKLVIIGNASCLTRDVKWRNYMSLCKELDCYFGKEDQQLERTQRLLNEVAIVKFEKCGLSTAIKNKKTQKEQKEKKTRK